MVKYIFFLVLIVLFINCKINFLVVYGLDIGLNSLVDICFKFNNERVGGKIVDIVIIYG